MATILARCAFPIRRVLPDRVPPPPYRVAFPAHPDSAPKSAREVTTPPPGFSQALEPPARRMRRSAAFSRAMYAPGNMGNESAAPHQTPTRGSHRRSPRLGSHPSAVPAVMKGKDPQCVRFGFPKGSLQKSTEELFARAGLPVKVKDRNYFPTVEDDGLSLVLFRRGDSLATSRTACSTPASAGAVDRRERLRRRRGCRAEVLQGDVQPRPVGRGGPGGLARGNGAGPRGNAHSV